MQGIVYGQTQLNSVLDSIIDSYVVSADGNLNAGDLCEFINGQIRKTSYATATSSLTQVNSVASTYISSTVLSATQILVAYSGTSGYLYAVILTISGATISVGTIYQVNSVSSTFMSSTTLSPTSALVSYVGASGYLWAVVLTISGTTISVGTLTEIHAYSSTYTSVVTLSSTSVFLAYNCSGLEAVVLTISGSTINVGTITSLGSLTGCNYVSIAMLSPTTLVVSCEGTSSTYMYSIVVNVNTNNNTLTAGTFTQITAVATPYVSSIVLSSTQVLINYPSTSSYLYSVILTITGLSISIGTPVQINSMASSYISSVLLTPTSVAVFYNGTSGYLYGVVLAINGFIINVGTITQLNSTGGTDYITSTALDATHIVVSYQNNAGSSYLWSVLLGISGSTISNTVVTHSKQPYVVCPIATISGNTVAGILKGIVTGLSGLTPQATYYCDDSGNLTTVQTRATEKAVGVALSSTDLLIPKGFWER